MHTRKFQVKYCDADFKDELKISAALAYFEEVACSSADELGFGYSYVKPRGYAFVLSGLCVEFLRPLTLGEEMLVNTWPLPPSYVVFGREYEICSVAGERLVGVSSRWCLIDVATGKIAQSKVIDNQDYSRYNTDRALENVQWKLPTFTCEEGTPRFSITIANSEYDHNLHVNNTRYADYCLNCFSLSELAEKWVKRFEITYVKQCKEGQTLRFYRLDCGDKEYLIQGVNECGETVTQARIIFENR